MYLKKLDYMVIEFAPNVTLSSQLMTAPKYRPDADGVQPTDPIDAPAQPWFKMNAIYADSAGNPKEPAATYSLCNAGSTTNQGNAQAGQPTNLPCGPIFYTKDGYIHTTTAYMEGGDSGGPAYVQGWNNQWVGIVSWVLDGPFGLKNYWKVYTSAQKILGDLNAQPGDVTGKGFKITNN